MYDFIDPFAGIMNNNKEENKIGNNFILGYRYIETAKQLNKQYNNNNTDSFDILIILHLYLVGIELIIKAILMKNNIDYIKKLKNIDCHNLKKLFELLPVRNIKENYDYQYMYCKCRRKIIQLTQYLDIKTGNFILDKKYNILNQNICIDMKLLFENIIEIQNSLVFLYSF